MRIGIDIGENKLEEVAIDEYCLSRALGSIIGTLDPGLIVIGRGIFNVARIYNTVPKLWSQWVFSGKFILQLSPQQFGDSRVVLSAAWLWDDATTL